MCWVGKFVRWSSGEGVALSYGIAASLEKGCGEIEKKWESWWEKQGYPYQQTLGKIALRSKKYRADSIILP